ncbi:MATE family efflux transporter [Kingella negevensis]|uniref:MATE family efflux transporter n=1 Tax=Kingella negevensis TaxID=1522312 RepID=UPI002542CAF6|nr:MATE family efflux transporter [Kingella negevensis]WII94294.1 MATE family efflux transporter [Kingella negevensis]
MIFDLNRYSWKDWRHEMRELLSLALPMMIGQVATLAIGVADTVMSGRASKADLAAVGLGSSVFSTVFITLLGVMAVLNPIIAQLHGSGKKGEVGECGRQGLWFGLIWGVVGAALLGVLIEPMKNYLQLDDYVKQQLGDYLFYVALGMPAALLYRALHTYASSLNQPKPIMWISWAALLLNIPLNYVFIYGELGFPKLGGSGTGVATAAVYWFSLAALWWYIARSPKFGEFGLFERFSRPDFATLKSFWHLGWVIGFSYFLEVSLFSFIVWLIAPLGANFVAAQQVVMSISGTIYMIPQAVGAAATVRVGYAIGRRQFARSRYISGVALVVGWLLSVGTVLFMAFGRFDLVRAYTSDVDVAKLAVVLMLFSAAYQVVDFTQTIASYALRGYKLTRVPMCIHAVAFWLLGLLPGYVLAYPFGMGIYGFWTALIVSLTAAAVALVWYLEKSSLLAKINRGL